MNDDTKAPLFTRDDIAVLSRQIAEAADAYRKFEAGLQLVIEEARKRWSQFAEQLQQAFEAITTIDWAEIDRNATQELLTLAELGWTVAPWMTLPQVSYLAGLTPEEVDREFTSLYFEYGGLKKTEKELTSSDLLLRWRPLLLQVLPAVEKGEHLIAIPALLLMLEGFVAQFANPKDLKLVCSTNVPTLVKAIRRSEVDRMITGRLWASTTAFLSQLYKRAPFSEDRPAFVNRHWILHGRDATEWTVADALRLLNALGTLHWLMVIQERRTFDSASDVG